MAQGSEYYQQQLEDMGELPDFKSSIADAYNKPILKPIIGEGQKLQEQYLPTIFDTFASKGTGAGDMSAAAKLQSIGRNLGRLSGQIGANRDVQSFYNSQIQDLANVELSRWQGQQQKLKDLYTMAFQREEAARAEAARRAAAAAENARIQAINDLMTGGGTGGGGGEELIADTSTLEGVNAKRAMSGLPGLSEAYYKNTYLPHQPGKPSDYAMSKVEDLLTMDKSRSVWSNLGRYYGGLFAAPGALAYSMGLKALGN